VLCCFSSSQHLPLRCTCQLQDSFKPPCSNIALGDERVSPFTTSYSTDFYAPFNVHERLRSPMRNKDLAATQTSLKEHYASNYNRVGE
jgi:hypothetical protein